MNVQPFVLYMPNVCVLFSALLCNNLFCNLQKPQLQYKQMDKLFISNRAKLILPKLVFPNSVCGTHEEFSHIFHLFPTI